MGDRASKLHIDNFAYYKCIDCGKKYLEYPPESCGCGSRDFNFVLGNDWWTSKGNPVMREIHH